MVGWLSVRFRRSPVVMRACVLIFVCTTPASGQATRVLPFVPPAVTKAVNVPPAVIAARADVARATARRAAAGAPGVWLLSAGASEVPEGDFGDGNVRLELGRDLLTGPRREAERAAADAELERATGALARAERRADAVLIRAAGRALGWDLIRRRRVAQDSLLTTAEEALRARFDAGKAKYLDVLRLRTERLRTASAIASAHAEAQGGEASLLALAGDAADRARLQSGLEAARESAASFEGPLPDLPTVDSLVATSSALALARADIQRVRAERVRDLAERRTQGSAFAGIQRIGGAEGGASWGPTLGITFSLPFLGRGANRRIRAAVDSSVMAAAAHLAATEADVTARVAEAVSRYLGARERVGIYQAGLLRGAQAERDLAFANYRDGTLSLLELLDFERALVDAEAGSLESVIAAANAWADLVDAQAGEPSTFLPE